MIRAWSAGASLLMGAILLTSTAAYAIVDVRIQDFSADSLDSPWGGWNSTTDPVLGRNWLQGIDGAAGGDLAFFPYPNAATSARALNLHELMWACGPGPAYSACKDSQGQITGRDGPTGAFFSFAFNVDDEHFVSHTFGKIIADDYFEFYANGQFVLSGLLTEHQTTQFGTVPQPVPIELPDFSEFLGGGIENVLAIWALDGFLKPANADCGPLFTEVATRRGPFCEGNSGFEYAFIEGFALVAPEPADLGLLAVALVGALAARGRRKAT